MTEEIERLAVEHASALAISKVAPEQGMITLRERRPGQGARPATPRSRRSSASSSEPRRAQGGCSERPMPASTQRTGTPVPRKDCTWTRRRAAPPAWTATSARRRRRLAPEPLAARPALVTGAGAAGRVDHDGRRRPPMTFAPPVTAHRRRAGAGSRLGAPRRGPPAPAPAVPRRRLRCRRAARAVRRPAPRLPTLAPGAAAAGRPGRAGRSLGTGSGPPAPRPRSASAPRTPARTAPSSSDLLDRTSSSRAAPTCT